MNLRVRSTAIAGRADPAAVPECASLRPSQRQPSLPTAVQEAELGAFPPLFLALLTRGGFFSPETPLPHPLLSQKLLDDFPNSALLPAHAANSASGPGPTAAPLELGAHGARGVVPARATPGLSRLAGAVPATSGTADHGAPGGAWSRPWSSFGGSLQGWSSGRVY